MISKVTNNIDYILEIPDAINSSFCREVIHNRISDTTLDPFEDIVCWKHKNIYSNWMYLFNSLDEKASEHIKLYFNQFTDIIKYEDIYLEGFGISRQKTGDYDRYHYDTNVVLDSCIKIRPFVFLIYLNENFHGGQLIFPSQKKIVEPKEGKVIIFPCSYMYPHKVAGISEGERFTLRLNYYLKKSEVDSDLDYWDNSKFGVQK
jgi:hypothetical protein